MSKLKPPHVNHTNPCFDVAQCSMEKRNLSKLKPLVVFSDDYGRHPSSCQHLCNRLLDRYQILWVNTIGMRRPQFNFKDFQRAWQKVKSWSSKTDQSNQSFASSTNQLPSNPHVVNPIMWPSFAGTLQRSLNAKLLTRSVNHAIRQLKIINPTVVTTVPITADLIGHIDAKRWIYYCVDDWSTWEGLDHQTLSQMECDTVNKVDDIIAVSPSLIDKMQQLGRGSLLLTHGVDLKKWAKPITQITDSTVQQIAKLPGPICLFWGMINKRISQTLLESLNNTIEGSVVLVGPMTADMHPLDHLPNVHHFDAIASSSLPQLAHVSDVLMMPYDSAHPSMQATQPLKALEYLSTDKPVVFTDIPTVGEWADCADVVAMNQFVSCVQKRATQGIDAKQLTARQRRLPAHDWHTKAAALDAFLSATQTDRRIAA